MQIDLLNGDCLKRLGGLQENSVDSIVTDPPYELGFMGKGWDKTGIANNVELWSECLRVLKPGGHLLAFSGTRTYHRMACAIEDAGFEVRDMIEWVYGSGFPKSRNIGLDVDKRNGITKNRGKAFVVAGQSGQRDKDTGGDLIPGSNTMGAYIAQNEWSGWGTALKPAHEPICMARKPLAEKTVAENCLKWGTGGINIDISRVSTYAYKDGGSNESIVPSHKLSELRGKLYTLLSSCVADKTDFPPFPNDGEYALRWKELSDFLCGCQFCRDLYDGLLPLFQEGDQVSFQQLHDVQDDIFRLHKEPSNNHGVCIFRPSTEDVLSQLKSYSNDTKLDIQSQGRFPANLLHDNSEEVRECFPETNSKWGKSSGVDVDPDQCSSFKIGLDGQGIKERTNKFTGDSGNASRFFKSIIYQAKASKSERNKGCEELEDRVVAFGNKNGDGLGRGISNTRQDLPTKNNHPTVKPIALMEYLIKMVTPKGGIVLDPFMGSGSTGVAAKRSGYGFIGIELDKDYFEIASHRIA